MRTNHVTLVAQHGKGGELDFPYARRFQRRLHDKVSSRTLLHNDRPVHGLMPHATILVADNPKRANAIKTDRATRHLPGDHFQVDGVLFDIEPVYYIAAGYEKCHLRALRDADCGRRALWT